MRYETSAWENKIVWVACLDPVGNKRIWFPATPIYANGRWSDMTGAALDLRLGQWVISQPGDKGFTDAGSRRWRQWLTDTAPTLAAAADWDAVLADSIAVAAAEVEARVAELEARARAAVVFAECHAAMGGQETRFESVAVEAVEWYGPDGHVDGFRVGQVVDVDGVVLAVVVSSPDRRRGMWFVPPSLMPTAGRRLSTLHT